MNKNLFTLATITFVSTTSCKNDQSAQEQKQEQHKNPSTPSVQMNDGLQVYADLLLAWSLASVRQARLTIHTGENSSDVAEYISAKQQNPSTKKPETITMATVLDTIAKDVVTKNGFTGTSFKAQIDNGGKNADKGVWFDCYAVPPNQKFVFTCGQAGKFHKKQRPAVKQNRTPQKKPAPAR